MQSLATNDFSLLGLILLLPLLGAVINGLFGYKLPKQIVWAVACGSVGLAFAVALYTVSTMWNASQFTEGHAAVEAEHGADAEHGEGEAEEAEAEESHASLRSPELSWVAFQWITSGDWAEGEYGYVPTEQFQVFDAQTLEACSGLTKGDPVWADKSFKFTNCLAGLYTPTIQTPEGADEQSGIGGVRARLKRDAHRFGGINIEAKFRVDALSAVMILIILGVGFLIHIYSIGYMRTDRSKSRYFSYLNLFIFAMLILVMGGNLIVMFVGWEGVGLCSYLLIGYYHEQHVNADAGKKAFIVNRVGDFAFMIGVLTLFWAFGTFDFGQLQAAVEGGPLSAELLGLITLACILIFAGCTGKSAQIPLYVWLPDAMAGPTPVSALIHAATMVTAGVYLVARLHFLFALSPTAMAVVAVIGGLTALFAATIALVQTDIKRVLAYSTVSQLGYMFLAVGVGAWWVGVFHLMTHAFFKALLFLGSGSVIDAMHHEQDIRVMGGLRKYMPVTAITFLIGCLAIAGVPLLSGFFSKDQILWYAWYNQFPGGFGAFLSWFLWGVGTITAGLTAFYMFRLYFLTFEGKCRASEELKPMISESPTTMTVPLAALAILSVAGGYLGVPHVLSGGVHFFESLPMWLGHVVDSPVTHRTLGHSAEVGWEWGLMTLSVLIAFAGIFVAYTMYVRKPELAVKLADRFRGPHRVLSNKYYVDELYGASFVRGTLVLGKFAYSVVDVVIIDFLLVRGLAWIYELGGNALKYFQNGDLQRYAAYVVLGLAAVVYLVLL